MGEEILNITVFPRRDAMKELRAAMRFSSTSRLLHDQLQDLGDMRAPMIYYRDARRQKQTRHERAQS